ncbi:MAG: M23 family metallopeptidase [Magnetospiraceae bacterium]
MKSYATLLLILGLSLAPFATQAGSVQIETETTQGGLLVGHVDPGSEARLDGNKVMVSDDGTFLIGFGRDAGPAATLSVRYPDKSRESVAVTITPRTYQEQHIKGLPSRKVTPNQEDLDRIKRDNAGIGKARARRTPEPLYTTGFIWPVEGIITGVWGTRRVLNGKPRSPHNGVDVAAPEGTPIRAPADGIVALVNPDMFYTGKTMILDHGQGLTTVYAHMSRIDVKEGDIVRQGDILGAVGATGRATGPHLHWGMTWKRMHVDPSLQVPPMPKPAKAGG